PSRGRSAAAGLRFGPLRSADEVLPLVRPLLVELRRRRRLAGRRGPRRSPGPDLAARARGHLGVVAAAARGRARPRRLGVARDTALNPCETGADGRPAP